MRRRWSTALRTGADRGFLLTLAGTCGGVRGRIGRAPDKAVRGGGTDVPTSAGTEGGRLLTGVAGKVPL